MKVTKVTFVSTLILLGFMAAAIFHYIQAGHFGRGYPSSTFLFRTDDMFNDYMNLYNFTRKGLHPYDNQYAIGYGPLPMLLLHFFVMLSSGWGMWALAGVFLSVSMYSLTFWTRKTPVTLPVLLILVLMPYPSLFALDRMNIELLSFSFVALFLILFAKERYQSAAFLLGLAGAVKIYLLCFICLFIVQKKYRPAISAILFFILISASSYFGLALLFDSDFFAMMKSHLGKYILYAKPMSASNILFTQHNHSLWAGVSGLNLIFHFADPDHYTPTYTLVSVALLFLFLGAATFLRWKLWQRIALISAAIVLLPAISFDYTLVNWILPLTVFLASPSEGKIDYWYSTLFAIPLIPVAYRYIEADVSISVIIYPLSILGLLFSMFIYEYRRA